MTSQTIKKLKLPDSPGVYFFLGKDKNILYIGKATSLRNRVSSYFRGDLMNARGPLIAKLIGRIKSVDIRKTDSVLEALLLEGDLIRKFKPEYNTADKDDKSYNCVIITREDFPCIQVVRKKDLDFNLKTKRYMLQAYFGPFPEGLKLKVAMKIIRKIFPYRDSCVPNSGKACFNRQIGLCPGVCTGEISKQEYAKTVRNIKLLFEGKKKSIIYRLKKEMSDYAKMREFEKAGRVKRTIQALSNIQDVSLISEEKRFRPDGGAASYRIEAYDIAHTSGSQTVGVMTVIEASEPNKSQYRMFKIRSDGVDDISGLKEVLSRRLRHEEWPLPDVIVVDGGISQKKAAERIISETFINSAHSIPVVAVTKDEYHRPKKIIGDRELIRMRENDILLANSEAHRFAISFHRRTREKKFLP